MRHFERTVAAVSLATLLTGCSQTSEAKAADAVLIENARVAFGVKDWAAICAKSYQEVDARGKRGPMKIDPPGERFTIWGVGGKIADDKLDELLVELQKELRALATTATMEAVKSYPVTEVPEPVATAMLLSSKQPLDQCKGFGLVLRAGSATAAIDVVAVPADGGWRLECGFRDTVDTE